MTSRSTRSTLAMATLALAVALVLPLTAHAGPRDHADGFLLRLSMGGGGVTSSIDTDAGTTEISGTASDLNIAIGGMVRPNLAIHGTLFGWYTDEPDVESPDGAATLNGDVVASGIGGGFTWYLMPANFYLSASAGFGSMEVNFGNLKAETDSGLMLDATLGKEWWVGDKWALGAAFGVQYHSLPDGMIDENWTGTTYCLRFTATMN
jgi:hypothetical protein